MNDLACPYCGTEQEASPDDYEPDMMHEHECIECGKIFGFEIEYYPSYTERELPCANGEPHKWVKRTGVPKEYFEDKKMCVYCGEEAIIEDGETGVIDIHEYHKERLDELNREIRELEANK
jgi:DNA-directed RNA polymerase subunit RPC12/RpoP